MADIRLVKRVQWGANPTQTPASRDIDPSRGGVTVHYEGTRLGDYPHSRCDDLVRGIQRFHIDGRGWADIAYSACVCRHGHTYEGRWLNHRTAANGTTPANDSWYAVCALVGPGDTLTDELLHGIRATVEYFWERGARRRVNGHRDHFSTDCPGDALYSWVRRGMPVAPVSPPDPDPVRRLCVLGTPSSELQPVAAGATESVEYRVEHLDPDGMHSANGSSIRPKTPGDYSIWARVTLDGLRRGDRVRLRFSRHDTAGGFIEELHGEERVGHGATLHTGLHTIDRIPADRMIRFQIVNPNPYEVTVRESQFRLAR
ncbi:hypothetical protein [Bailinhaonella thermotolerans]|uniref:Peptidoglycan recognition protein family domain-containing protein n=1 Tax=Bailinhaonella thermotolerans TaxID=1070861 RepID=A0A3A4B0V7_9ACTN|nr:hypothetical protein [Bailinhaonella thermotolerans]RJL34469.1 hypothetical protein D5H75_08585 [Bailinhaonella thermotolerans]